ncbi:hypothetical protein EDB82DRAFT_477544 [Fusarium venenatum]|uniref:uncharacterized protein n=1 Tax=Fusarium venenatum TaxID=56646 RepID=UPI001DF3945D|nr:hypothetical protein EDB82DRAFT_477544 [Fusarium venenatum]
METSLGFALLCVAYLVICLLVKTGQFILDRSQKEMVEDLTNPSKACKSKLKTGSSPDSSCSHVSTVLVREWPEEHSAARKSVRSGCLLQQPTGLLVDMIGFQLTRDRGTFAYGLQNPLQAGKL